MLKKSERNLINWLFEAATLMAALAFGGSYLDNKYGLHPYITTLGVLVGLLAIGWNFYKIYKDVMREEE